MSTASGSNDIQVEVGAEIASVTTGLVDVASYPLSASTKTVPINTDVIRQTFLAISDVDFGAGDTIVFFVKRLGDDGSDIHPGNWQLVSYEVSYTGQIAARRGTQHIEVFSDTDETPPPSGAISSFATLDYTTGVDQEQKIQFSIPESWDEVSDITLRLTYAMSAGAVGDVRFATEGEAANVSTGAVDVIALSNFDFTASATTAISQTVTIRSIPAVGRNIGDVISLKIARRGLAAEDTHTANFQMMGACINLGIGPSSAVSTVQEIFVPVHDFRIISGAGVSGEQDSVDFAGDFELWYLMTSSVASGRIDVEYFGHLSNAQTLLRFIRIPIKGNAGAEYQIKVYVEGQGATPVYDSGLNVAPLTRTLIQLDDTALSNQPTGEKKYVVAVEAHIDAGEELRVGRPFVRQE
jgi:hypothetical protein